ncbi:ThiF family adenylyltransferase [Streptomyces mangrovi]|uniref:ThiF family adenylyltransferase n=1 Tax=Streptomyces mangrovi TaxID=1206892 RepID=UPI00399D4B50
MAEPPRRLRLVDTVTVLPSHDGVQLVQSTRALRVRGPADVRQVVDDLRRGVAEETLRDAPRRSALRRLVEELKSAGWLTADPVDPPVAPEAQRQLGYLSLFGPDAVHMQQRIDAARVAVVGMGGVGTVVAQHLVGAGVRQLWLIDFDRVAPHNLNRQFLFSYEDVGLPKAEAAAKALRRLAPGVDARVLDVRVDGVGDLSRLPASLELLVCAADTPPDIAGIAWEWAHKHDVPLHMAAVGLETGYWGPLLVPSRGHCWPCFESARRSRLPAEQAAWEASRHEPTPYSFGPSNTAVSALLAHDALRFLATGHCPAENRRGQLMFGDGRISYLDGVPCACSAAQPPA